MFHNVFGYHFNALSFALLDSDALGIGWKVLELIEAFTDPDAGWPGTQSQASTGQTPEKPGRCIHYSNTLESTVTKKQKLEQTWIGKKNRPRLEARMFLEDPEKSYLAQYRVKEGNALAVESAETSDSLRSLRSLRLSDPVDLFKRVVRRSSSPSVGGWLETIPWRSLPVTI
jgi:hypothetical protein